MLNKGLFDWPEKMQNTDLWLVRELNQSDVLFSHSQGYGRKGAIPNTNKETSSYILFSDTKYVILKLYNYNTMLCVHFYAVWLL